ncbi:MAG: response regulator [Victivallales bacterium]|nr:response regulator [Victivallales bacterium]
MRKENNGRVQPTLIHFDRVMAWVFSIVVLLLMLIVAMLGSIFFSHISGKNDDALQETITGLLASSINRISFSGKYHARALVRQIIESQPRIKYIAIVDSDGKIIAGDLQDISDEENLIKQVLKEQKTSFLDVLHNGDLVRQVAMPYASGYHNLTHGVIFVGISKSEVKRDILFTYMFLGGIILLLSMLSLAATLFLSRKIARPVIDLAWQYQEILDHAPLLIRISDGNGKLLGCSSLFADMYKNESRLLSSEVRQVFEKNKCVEGEVTYSVGDQVNTFLVTSFPVLQERGKIRQACSIALDISERKQAEEELRQLRNYLSNIIDSMPSVLIGVDVEGHVTQWNKQAERATGRIAGHVIGRKLVDVLPYMSSEIQRIAESIRTRQPRQQLNIPRQYNGSVLYEDFTIYPLVANGVEGAVIRIDDVTKEHDLEEQLNHSRRIEAIGQLAGGIAHDFNNILAGITSAAELLKKHCGVLNEKDASLVDLILRASARAADLTYKLLAFGRKEITVSASVNIHNVIDETVAMLTRTLDKKISVVVEKNASAHSMVGDAASLQNALLNLGINASHAMPDGGVITIETENIDLDSESVNINSFELSQGKYVKIQVNDTGCGIPPENMQKIFEPFFTTREQGKGSGLGLASVHGIVRTHHGAISVSSTEGSGSTFTILLPCSKESAADVIKDNETVIHGRGLVLLVDDEDVVLYTSTLMLEEMGYKVMSAHNGKEALEIFKKHYHEISVVIMDVIMPVMNGREAFMEMKKIDRDCKVIIASGFSRDEDIVELKAYGLAGYIHKPYRDYDLGRLLIKVTSQNN